MAESGSHHDALFKWSFGQLDRAAGELRTILPAPDASAAIQILEQDREH